MNSLINLWNVISSLATTLTRTNELVQTLNGRMERTLGLDQPEAQILAIESEPTKSKKK